MKIEYTEYCLKNIKILNKKYKNFKNDLTTLIFTLRENPTLWTNLWNWFYKIRVQNSDNNKWKSWGYRTITYYNNWDKLLLIAIYSKSELENISEEKINKILNKYLDK